MVIAIAQHKPCGNGAIRDTFTFAVEEGQLLRKVESMKKNGMLVGALMAATLATPVLAASEDVCLQHNRIWSWRAVNDRTLVVSDKNLHYYTVRMNPGCIGLTNGAAKLVFRTWQNLGCVDRGDIIGVNSPGLGFVSCSIAGVEGGAP